MNMEEIRREAMDDYKRRTKEQKQVAWQFFQAIDKDGTGSISVHEFTAFLRENGLYKDNFFSVFVDLGKDGGGVLDFDEVITLFYMFNHEKYGQNLVNMSKSDGATRNDQVWQTTTVREVTVDPGMIKEPLQVLKELTNVWNVGKTVVNEIRENRDVPSCRSSFGRDAWSPSEEEEMLRFCSISGCQLLLLQFLLATQSL